jgi:hypothetical protein
MDAGAERGNMHYNGCTIKYAKWVGVNRWSGGAVPLASLSSFRGIAGAFCGETQVIPCLIAVSNHC